MGSSNVFRNHSSNFVEQLKIDAKSSTKVLGVYINPLEFPTSGLIVVSTKAILSYNPIYGNLNSSYTFPKGVLYVDYNRKSKDGSILAVVTDDMKCYFISTENLTVNRTVNIMTKMTLRIKENSKISCINFKLNDSLLLACSDGSAIKCKLNDEPVNLLYEFNENKFQTPEDEFESIKSVFSSDTSGDKAFNQGKDNNSIGYIQSMLISDRYKVLFCVQKAYQGVSNVTLFNLRNNNFMFVFCKIKGSVQCACLDDKRDLLIVINYSPETKKTIIELWVYNDSSCPISTYEVSALLDYSFTISSVCLTQIPNMFYGRYSNKGKVEGDVLSMGTTKGDIIIGNICILHINNKIGFDYVMMYKLNKDTETTSDISNKFEITWIAYDLNFDVMYIADASSNVRFIEKVLQIGKKETVEENLPFFSFYYEPIGREYCTDGEKIIKYPETKKANYNLPIFSINHDVIKDRNIILYDKGRNIKIVKIKEEEENDEDRKENDSNEDSDLNSNHNNNQQNIKKKKVTFSP